MRAMAVVLVLGLGSQVMAQEALKSGPQPGQFLPGAFHPLNVNGVYAGRPHCLVCEHGLKPVVAVFAREHAEKDKPLSILLKQLDELVSKQPGGLLRAFAVFLVEDYGDLDKRRAQAARLQNVIKALDLKSLGVALETSEGPPDYAINKEADVTVLLYYKHKVVANFAFRKDAMTDKDVETILEAARKLGK